MEKEKRDKRNKKGNGVAETFDLQTYSINSPSLCNLRRHNHYIHNEAKKRQTLSLNYAIKTGPFITLLPGAYEPPRRKGAFN